MCFYTVVPRTREDKEVSALSNRRCNEIYSARTASISILDPLGRALTCIVARAG